ncbi:(Fe-S)-binding protein [Actinoplanes sp. CA-142083]|uniref:(Fe-S)-binding protein n=1 Tax=Actinoplanes sp. CA-142083 TaxID=3239903 RepID=UPI003D917921
MGIAQIVATVLAGAVTITAVVLAVRAVRTIVSVIVRGQPDPSRFVRPAARAKIMLRETLGHTRMLKWSVIGAAHWFVMVSFLVLSLLVLEAYFEVVDPAGGLPVIGHWVVYGLVTEWLGVLGLAGILYLIVVRQRAKGGRFLGSTMWQAYFVEGVILGVLVCGFLIRGFKVANDTFEFPAWATPLSHAVGSILPKAGDGPTWVALVKLLISMGWLITIGLNPTMGVAWHRFLAFFNIFFKRDALGALRPMMSGGKPLDFEEADPDKDRFGVGAIDQFTWKGLLDFATCTECGRCQSQCPAWNTAKPLSPKLMVLSLRDHAFDVLAMAEKDQPLIGDIIDPDVLWSCTTCGACVEQCPVDIEHVDHIVDMRRYQVLIESSFPSEAGVMLRNLENKGNPWGAPQSTREDWTKGLDFEIKNAAEGDFEYLFWVGCAGAFEDRAKKTTRAVARLLHEAGVDYAILGEGETCTGDPARRIGNEFVFQMLAQQNVETLREANVKKIVATCPHCFNTLGNEYEQLGLKVEVVHHTQLLAHLVATGKLTPVKQIEGELTYHDPCYLGRHNRIFDAPRELLGDIQEMPRHRERSFCCGAGGARMWMEEKIGKRINIERTEEALATGAKTIAVGCPFCSTMIGDGVTSKGEQENVEVVDVATVLLQRLDLGV